MKKYMFFCLILMTTGIVNSQILNWVKQSIGTSDERSYSIARDASGNVYTIGYYSGSVDFDPGPAIYNLTCAGSQPNTFISKLDASGNFVWAKSLGGISDCYGQCVVTDASGNVYCCGYFQLTADFDPGPGTFNLTPVGNYDAFICKLDASGNFLWAIQLGGTGLDVAWTLVPDVQGNTYCTGYFNGTVDFDPGSGTYNLTSAGGTDAYIVKLDASGNFVWAAQQGGSSTDGGRYLKLDATGNIYITGYFSANADLDPGTGTFNVTSVGMEDIFVCRLNTSGGLVWAKQFGGPSTDYGRSIVLDASGNIYTTGSFQGTTDFDTGPGTFNLTSNGMEDIFIHKLNSSGNFIWAQQFGGASFDFGWSIAVDNSGSVYTAGSFRNTVDFDPGTGVFNLTSFGLDDVFINKLTSSGNFVWTAQMGGDGWDICRSLTVDVSGSIYSTGYFKDTADYDPGVNTTILISTAGNDDVFIHKMTQSMVSALENSTLADIRIYPNPSYGKFLIEAKGELVICNIIGKVIFSQELTDEKTEIDLSQHPPGVYCVKIITEKGVYSQKILIQH
ncbi:MAG: SBBP repeat-containing protein [Bacteroidota bacterium]